MHVCVADGSASTPPTTQPHSCRADYTSFNGACYRVIASAQSWAAASALCAAEGATLASIHGGQDNAALLLLAGAAAPFWIGYSKVFGGGFFVAAIFACFFVIDFFNTLFWGKGCFLRNASVDAPLHQ